MFHIIMCFLLVWAEVPYSDFVFCMLVECESVMILQCSALTRVKLPSKQLIYSACSTHIYLLYTVISKFICWDQYSLMNSVSLCEWTVWFRMLHILKLVLCSWCFQHLLSHYMRTWTHKLHLQQCSEFTSWAFYYFSGEKLLSSYTQTET